MTSSPLFYDIHQMLLTGESLRLGVLAIETNSQGRIEQMQFRYEDSFLAHPEARPISPLMPVLSDDTYTFKSDGDRSWVL